MILINLIVLCNVDLSQKWGDYARIFSLMKSFSKIGHHVSILVIRPEFNPAPIAYMKDGVIDVIEVHPPSFLKIRGKRGVGKYINYLLCIPTIFKITSKIMKDKKIDFIYSYMPGIGSSLPGMLLKSRFNIKHILDFADLHVYVRPKFVANQSFKNADIILVITEYLKNELLKKHLSSEKIHIIPNGVDLELFSTKNYNEQSISALRNSFNSKKIILFSGALQDLNILFGAAKEIIKDIKDVKFVIVGDHRDPFRSKDAWQKKAINLGLDDYFIFLGRKPREEIPLYILSSDICVDTFPDEPYFAAAHPVKLLEYGACGKPVVATRVSETEKLIKHGHFGFLADPKNSKEFACHIITLLNSPDLRKRMGNEFFKYISENFDWEIISHKLDSALKD